MTVENLRHGSNQIGIWSVGFAEGGKVKDLEKKPSEQGQEPATNSTYMCHQVWESNPGHNKRQALSPLCQVVGFQIVCRQLTN